MPKRETSAAIVRHRTTAARLRHRRLMTLALSASLILASATQADQPVRVGLFEMPPYYSQDSNGQPTGELIDTLDRVMTQLGLRWQGQFMPVPQALQGVVMGQIDLLMIIRHPMVEGKAQYARSPMGSMALLAFHRTPQADITQIQDLRGQRVAILRGYGYGGMLNQLLDPSNGLRISIADTHADAFSQLNASEVDYVLDYRKPGLRTIEQLKLSGISGSLLNEKPIYFVVSNQAAQQRHLLADLERVSAALQLP